MQYSHSLEHVSMVEKILYYGVPTLCFEMESGKLLCWSLDTTMPARRVTEEKVRWVRWFVIYNGNEGLSKSDEE